MINFYCWAYMNLIFKTHLHLQDIRNLFKLNPCKQFSVMKFLESNFHDRFLTKDFEDETFQTGLFSRVTQLTFMSHLNDQPSPNRSLGANVSNQFLIGLRVKVFRIEFLG